MMREPALADMIETVRDALTRGAAGMRYRQRDRHRLEWRQAVLAALLEKLEMERDGLGKPDQAQ
jgi:hypothetical protein